MKSLVENDESKGKPESIEDSMIASFRPVKPEKKKRTCLLCGKLFNSAGPFNRRCQRCSRLVSLGKAGNFSDTVSHKVVYNNQSSFGLSSDLVSG